MTITITIDIPEDKLLVTLVREDISRAQFIASLKEGFAPMMNAEDLVHGATAKITFS